MTTPLKLILASTSPIRQHLLQAAGLSPQVAPPRVDEEMITTAMLADGASPRDIADALAQAKAQKVANHHPNALVLGCDQTLDLGGALFSKPQSQDDAQDQLHRLQGQTHHIFSAAVVFYQGQAVWRHVGHARMTMRPLSRLVIGAYVVANWDSIRHCVGCYKIEDKGVQLFSEIEGDIFTIQGIPLIPLINYLVLRGALAL